MGNATWVCFECRQAMRRATYSGENVKCSRCGQRSHYVGYKTRIPAMQAKNEWTLLRKTLEDKAIHRMEQARKSKVRWRHELEKELAELKSRPGNPGRVRAMRLLERKMKALSD